MRPEPQQGQGDVRDLEHRVLKLFEAALSVPIRLRLNPDPDSYRLLSLRFSEQTFAVMGASGADSFWKFAEKIGGLGAFKKTTPLSIPKALAALKLASLLCKGKCLTEQSVKALRALASYVEDARCSAAFSMLECLSPSFETPHYFCVWRSSAPLVSLAGNNLRPTLLKCHSCSSWSACASLGWRATSSKRTSTPFRP